MQTQRGSTPNLIPHRGPRRKEVQPLYNGLMILYNGCLNVCLRVSLLVRLPVMQVLLGTTLTMAMDTETTTLRPMIPSTKIFTH